MDVRGLALMRRRHGRAARILVAMLPLAIWVFGSMGASAAAAGANRLTSNINVISAQIDTMGFETFPDSYGGLKRVTADSLIVFLSKDDPRLVSQVSNVANTAGLHLTYVSVRHSFAQLVSLEQQMVNADRARLLRDGVAIVDVHPDAASNRLVVTLETPASPDRSYTQRAQGALTRLYGSGLVTVNSNTMLPTTEATYRYDDYAPFYGGDQIGASGYGYCSSGLPNIHPYTTPTVS